MANRVKGHDTVAMSLADHGLRMVFGLLGDGNLGLVDRLVRDHNVEYIPANREDGAVMMADGYARVTGEVGFASVTHGPGLTNAITPLHEAVKARTPLLLLCGDTAASDRAHNQNIDQRATIQATGAGYHELRSVDTIGEDVAIALRQAQVERRPVALNLPAEIQADESPSSGPPPRYTAAVHHSVAPDPDALDHALGVAASSQRPLILVGRGAVDAQAKDAIVQLADVLNAPLATTLKARGWCRGHPYDLGVLGSLSYAPALDTIALADCLLAFGASLNRYTTVAGSFLEGRRVVQVDLDPTSIGRWYPVDVGVVGDVKQVATTMSAALERLGPRPEGLRSPKLAARLEAHEPDHEFQDRSSADQIDPNTLMVWLDRTLSSDRALVVDCGGFMEAPLRFIGVGEPRDQVLPANFGAVGLAVGTAVGAAFARPERPVLTIVGDGGFMMSGMTEFETAVRYALDLVVVVLNNGGYGIEYRNLQDLGGDPKLSEMAWPDPVDIARSLGGDGVRITNPDDLPAVARAIEQRRRPLLIDARIGGL